MVKTIAVFVALISMQVASAGMINSAAPQPTLEQNFSAARTVFRGRVKTQTRYQTPQGTNAYKIQLDVSEAWKGSPPASITVYHPTVNMFEPFGQTATPGSECLVFLNEKNEVQAKGVGSVCVGKGELATESSIGNQNIRKLEARIKVLSKSGPPRAN